MIKPKDMHNSARPVNTQARHSALPQFVATVSMLLRQAQNRCEKVMPYRHAGRNRRRPGL